MGPASDVPPAAAAVQPGRKAASEPVKEFKYDFSIYEESPSHPTAPNRKSVKMRDMLEDLIGLKTCALTNMMTAPWMCHGIHATPRALQTLDPVAYDCFVEAVGSKGYNDAKNINFDYVGNVDLVHIAMHSAYDGPLQDPARKDPSSDVQDGSQKEPTETTEESAKDTTQDPGQKSAQEAGKKTKTTNKKAQYGWGDWAFAPEAFDDTLDYLIANRGQDYKQLYPLLSGPHRLRVYGFQNEHQHVFPRYSPYPRTYSHSLNKDKGSSSDGVNSSQEESSEEDVSDAADSNDATPEDNVELPSITLSLKQEIWNEYKDKQRQLEIRVLETGYQDGIVVVSHLNLVFVVFDFAYKMWRRVEAGLYVPPEDLAWFHARLWPAVGHWIRPTPPVTLRRVVDDNVHGQARAGAAQTAPDFATTPATPEPARLARTTPIAEDSSPCGPDLTPTGLNLVPRAFLPGNNMGRKSFLTRTRFVYASSDVEPESSPPPSDEANLHTQAGGESVDPSAATSSGVKGNPVASGDSARHSVRFDIEEDDDKDDSNPEHRTNDNDDDSARTAAPPALSSDAVSIDQAASSTQPPPLDPRRLRRTTRSNAGHPPKPIVASTAATKSTSSGRTSAAAGFSTTTRAVALSSDDQGPRKRPPQLKQTGDKRARDELEDDDDNDEDAAENGDGDPDASEAVIPAKRARKKTRAPDAGKSTARASSKGASKKGSKSGK